MKFRMNLWGIVGVVLVCVGLVCQAADREQYSITELRTVTIRGMKNTDTVTVPGPITLSGAVTVSGTVTISGTTTNTGAQVFNNTVTINEDLAVNLNATDEEVRIASTTNTAAMLTISNSAVEVTGATIGLRIRYIDDGESDADFISCEDNGGDAKFTVSEEGNTVIVGTLGVTGIGTFTAQSVHNGGVDINELVDVDLDATDEDVRIDTSAGVLAGSAVVTISNSLADVTVQQYLMKLIYEDDGDADADFLVCRDNGVDDMFAVDNDGNVVVAGTALVGGVATFSSTIFVTNGATIGGATLLNSTLGVQGIVTTAADVNNDATGGSTGDPDFDVDGYFKANGVVEVDGKLQADAEFEANADVDINFDSGDEEIIVEVSTNAYAAGLSAQYIQFSEDADGDNQQYGLRIGYANDGGANNEYIICQDNNYANAKFTVAEEGNTTIAGWADIGGAITGGSTLFVTNGMTIGGTTLLNDTLTMAPAKEVVIDGKWASVGPDAATALMIDSGTCTNGQASVSFNGTFGAAPRVVVGWIEDVSVYTSLTNTGISATSPTTTTFIPKTLVAVDGMGLTNMQWVAIGQRP